MGGALETPEQLRQLLVGSGSVSDIAAKTGVPPPQVSRLRNGRRLPSWDTFEKLARGLKWRLVCEDDLPAGLEPEPRGPEERGAGPSLGWSGWRGRSYGTRRNWDRSSLPQTSNCRHPKLTLTSRRRPVWRNPSASRASRQLRRNASRPLSLGRRHPPRRAPGKSRQKDEPRRNTSGADAQLVYS